MALQPMINQRTETKKLHAPAMNIRIAVSIGLRLCGDKNFPVANLPCSCRAHDGRDGGFHEVGGKNNFCLLRGLENPRSI
jgi:hypothetical protein